MSASRASPWAGLRVLAEALRLLGRERSLWPWAAAPAALSALALLTTLALVVAYAGSLYGWVSGWIPPWEVESLLAWLWTAPLLAAAHALAALAFLTLAALALACAYLVSSVLAAPFHEALSRRVEAVVTGGVVEQTAGSWREALRVGLRSLVEEVRRLVFFAGFQAMLLAVALLIPGGGLLAVPAAVLATALFLPLDYASYVLDRRGAWSFRAKRQWMRRHAGVLLGFGSGILLLGFVPGLNVVAVPGFVVAGTLLALRYPPQAPFEAR